MHKIFIISGPTGVGKTTIAKELFKLITDLKPSTTYSTRPPRPSAIEDKIIIHITEQDFKTKISNNEFLEYAEVHRNFYGTAKKETLDTLKNHPILCNIDVVGADQIKKEFPGQCVTIFILPESVEQLVKHVKKRGDVTDEELAIRLQTAEKEIEKSKTFDHIIINQEGKLKETIKAIKNIIEKNLKIDIKKIF